MWEMAHSIRLEKLYHIRQQQNFRFFVSDYLNYTDISPVH